MLVTLLGITVPLQPTFKVFVAVSMMALQSLRESKTGFPSSTFIEARASHAQKGVLAMLVTPFGIMLFLHPTTTVFLSVSMMALQLLRESYIGFPSSTVIETKLGQNGYL